MKRNPVGPTPSQDALFRDVQELARKISEEASRVGFYRAHTPEAQFIRGVGFFLGCAERMLREAQAGGYALVHASGSPNSLDATPLLRLIPLREPAKVIDLAAARAKRAPR